MCMSSYKLFLVPIISMLLGKAVVIIGADCDKGLRLANLKLIKVCVLIYDTIA